ncbi:MAG: ATP cone domain-containing protein, partial [Bacillota bacterium]
MLIKEAFFNVQNERIETAKKLEVDKMYVLKRNGSKEEFDLGKIANAMLKAYHNVGADSSLEDCLKQAQEITKAYPKTQEVNIEIIQDDVELYLMKK